MHENLSDDHVVEGPTNRSFGLVFAALFLGIGIWPVVSNHEVRWWAIGASGLLVFLALLLPGVLAHPNRLWMKLGLALGKVTSTVALTVLRDTRLFQKPSLIPFRRSILSQADRASL